MAKEEIEKVFNNHKQIIKEYWVLTIVFLSLFGNKETSLKELDNLLTRLEKGNIDLLKEEIKNE